MVARPFLRHLKMWKVHLKGPPSCCALVQVGTGLRPSHPQDYSYLTIRVRDEPDTDIVGCFSAAFKFIEEARAQDGRFSASNEVY
jgi:hypothetical protein